MNRSKQLKDIQKEAHEQLIKKNTEYESSFEKHGPVGMMIRMEDKILKYLSVNKNRIFLANTKSLRDTLIDIHNYAAMAIVLLDETREDIDKQDNKKDEKQESKWKTLINTTKKKINEII